MFGTPKYSEFHRTAPLEETGGKAWVLFYNMHTVSDFAKHLLQLSSEEQILFGTPKYSEFHRTAPLEETGGKAWVLFYNMHTVSDLRLIYIVISRLLSL